MLLLPVVCNFDDENTTDEESNNNHRENNNSHDDTTNRSSQSPSPPSSSLTSASSPSSSSFVKPHNKTVETLKHNGEYRKEYLKSFGQLTDSAGAGAAVGEDSGYEETSASGGGGGGSNKASPSSSNSNINGLAKYTRTPPQAIVNGSNGTEINNRLRPTLSQAMMNSNLLNSLPKYIFQSDHEQLTSVNKYIQDLKDQEARESSAGLNAACEVSEYPIEFIEHQAHVINRHISK